MNKQKKKQELEAMLNLLIEWAIKYKEDFVHLSIINNAGMADVDLSSEDHDEMDLYIPYETPAAGTARESK